MWTQLDTPWIKVADQAAEQHGVISWWQLLDLGVSRRSIKHAAATGRLHRIYRGVYAVGHKRISLDGRFMAAVLACGEGALLSHRSAGELWGLRFDYWKVEVTAKSAPEPILVHRTRRTPPAALRRGIPVTSLGRTLVDLADVVSANRLERAFEDAERLGLPRRHPRGCLLAGAQAGHRAGQLGVPRKGAQAVRGRPREEQQAAAGELQDPASHLTDARPPGRARG
jgi:hypothetical protein